MLPINQPRCPFHFGQEDGAQNWMHRDEEVSHEDAWAGWLIDCCWQQHCAVPRSAAMRTAWLASSSLQKFLHITSAGTNAFGK